MKVSTLVAAASAALSVLLLPALGVAGDTLYVDCNAGNTIEGALATAKPGATVLVTGDCRENVQIAGWDGLTLDGQDSAIIRGSDSARNTVELVSVRNVTVKGFRITGGRDGIVVNAGHMIALERNTVEQVGRSGIQVQRGTTLAHVTDSVIRNNPQHGIVVNENSYVRIGFGSGVGATEGDPGPNTIEGNGGHGIHVQRNSMARIYLNAIRSNGQNGVNLEKLSFAEVASNVIEGNSRHGVQAMHNSGVHLGTETGNGNENRPNTTGPPNGQMGIDCSLGAYSAGRLGTLMGARGAKNFATGANDGLLP
jgi:hypothetical protein